MTTRHAIVRPKQSDPGVRQRVRRDNESRERVRKAMDEMRRQRMERKIATPYRRVYGPR